MEQGCPTVGAEVGQWLMSEVERSQQTKAKMRAVMAGLKLDGTPEQERWKQLRDLFPDVPLRILQRIPGDSKWKGERLPFNRRVRRKLERASMVVVHAFCGKDDGFWKRLETDKIAVLPLDLCHGADLLDPDLGGFLEELAMKGKINLWLAGPPCRSTSVARHREDSGPKPVRGRDLQDRFGLSNLQPHEQHLVDQDSTLWLKNLWWIWLARQHQLPDGWFQSLVEQPQDPCEWKDPQGEFPSFTIWPETKKVLAAVGMKSTRLEQGALGHSTPKPTVLMSSIPEVASLEGLKSQSPGKVWPSTVNERLKFSSSLAEWAPGLKRLLAEVIQQRGETGPGLKRLTQSDKESIAAWQAHFDMNHIPFRHDCSVCLESAGKDRQRRKLECRSSYCMSVDIAGPFQPGQDQAQGVASRYFIVANVSIPMTSSGPLVDGLRDLGFKLRPPAPKDVQENLDGEKDMGVDQAEDPLALQVDDSTELEEDQVVQVVSREEDEQRWKEFIKGAPEVESKILTFSLPLVSRKTHHVVTAVASIYARVRAMQIPLLRIHTDRAQEFAGAAFRKWCVDRSLWHTMSPGDEPTQNSRVERSIGLLKARVRTLLKASQAPLHWWPLALRHASESMLKDQLWQMGIFTPRLPAFGSRAIARSKTWHQRSTPWKFPGCKVRVWGPASDMSLTSGGVYIQDEQGRWMRSTVVRPVCDPETDDQGRVLQDRLEVPNSGDGGSHPTTPGPVQEISQTSENEPEPPLCLQQHQPLEQPEVTVIIEPEGLLRDPQQKGSSSQVPCSTFHGSDLEGVLEIEKELIKPIAKGYDPPKYRLQGKQVPLDFPSAKPVLCPLRTGGESGEEQNSGLSTCEEDKWVEGINLLQHRILKEMVLEETSRVPTGGVGPEVGLLLEQLHRSVSALEQVMSQPPQLRSIQFDDKGEVLQTQTVSMEDVKKEMDLWIQPFKTEVETILESGAMERISEEKYRRLLQEHPDLEKLPMLAVATIKPPLRRKGRIVVCGNYSNFSKSNQQDGLDPSVGGVDTIGIRSVIDASVHRGLRLGTIDVKGAFLQAPRRSVAQRPTVCEPPNILRQMQLVGPQEKWLVHKALYGFVESPSDWAQFRDDSMRSMRWVQNGQTLCLCQTNERHIWKIHPEADLSVDYGYLAVYVDDILFGVEEEHLSGLVEALQAMWTCSPPEFFNDTTDMRFCGFELRAVPGGGIRLGQSNYVKEIVKKRGISGKEQVPLPKIVDDEDEILEAAAVKAAQGVVGELTWLTTRSRPDIAYGVGILSRLVHKRPRYAVELSQHLLRYLHATADWALTYYPCGSGDLGQDEELAVQRSVQGLEIYADASFSLPHERFKSVTGVAVEHAGNLLAWESGAQPFISQSTAESEVIAYNTAYQAGESVGMLLVQLGFQTEKRLYGDSRAGIAVLAAETGP